MSAPQVWLVFYSSVMSMFLHPSGRKGCPPFEVSEYCLDQAALVADRMLTRFVDRFVEVRKEVQ